MALIAVVVEVLETASQSVHSTNHILSKNCMPLCKGLDINSIYICICCLNFIMMIVIAGCDTHVFAQSLLEQDHMSNVV